MSTTTHPAEIISFYSFKGGAGRTMALANTAWILARNGKSVLAIDWDLEAPGLHRYYRQFLPDPDLEYGTGVLDMFHNFAEAARGQEDLTRLHDEHTDFERYTVGLDTEFPNGGRLKYLGPGRMDDGYVDRLQSFNWSQFHSSEEGREFLTALRERLRASDYDYVLIDSRTGFSDGAGICTLALPDTVIIGLAMNSQAIEGAAQVAERISRCPRPITLHMLPMHIEMSEMVRFEQRMREARRALDRYLVPKDEDELEIYWGEVQVPYRPFFAYGEELAVFIESPRQSGSVLAQYVKVARRITGGEVSCFDPVPVTQREWYDRTYSAARPPETQSVTMLHAPDDQMWADWIREQLRMAGIQMVDRPHDDGRPDRDLPDTDYLLVLLSPQLQDSPDGRTVERLIASAPVSSVRERRIVGVRVSGGRLAEQFDWRDTANLSGLSEGLARKALLARFGIRTDDGEPTHSAGPRFPDRQPDVWQVPVRNPAFTGRVKALQTLRESFGSGSSGQSGPQVLYGMAGVGKTQIALEYAHRFASEFDMVWWVPASDANNIRASFTRLAKAVNANSGGARTGEDWEGLVEDLRRGRHCPRWLIVFDDAADQETIEPFIPSGGAGQVLITTRASGWSHFAPRQVDVFTSEESLTHLRQRLTWLGDEELSVLAERVGHLPMAEETAIAGLDGATLSVGEYITRLDSNTSLPEPLSPDSGKFAAGYLLLYDDLKVRSPAAAKLMDLCAFMSPDGIGLRKIIQSRPMLALLQELDDRLRDTIWLRILLNQLQSQCMAMVDPSSKTLKVHRLVQDLLRHRMTDEEREHTRAQALTVLASIVPNDLERDDPVHRRTFAELDKHLVVSGALESDDPAVHSWVVSQIRYRWMQGRWSAARELGLRVLERWRTRLGAEATVVLRLEGQVGAACRMLGRYAEALVLSKHSATAQRERDSHDLYALIAGHGYAADLRATGRFEEACLEDSRTYYGLRDLFGDDHPETLNAANNLAVSKFYVESVDSARRHDQQTHALRKRILSDNHPLTWNSYVHLGLYYRELGELRLSVEHLYEARNQLVRILGEDAHLTLWTLQNLGMTLMRAGRVHDALRLLQDAHMSFQRQWGDDHPDTMSCRLAVAAGLHADGRSGDAADYAKQVLQRYVTVFGDDHPFTGMARTNLALYLLASGSAEEASRHARKAANQLKDAFRRDHRYSLVARMNLNNCSAVLEEVSRVELAAEDEAIHEDCLQSYGWGDKHAITLIAKANLADSRPQDSAGLLSAVTRQSAEYVGEANPLTAALNAQPYHRLGADLEVLGV